MACCSWTPGWKERVGVVCGRKAQVESVGEAAAGEEQQTNSAASSLLLTAKRPETRPHQACDHALELQCKLPTYVQH
jgi:hypothetical protein